MKTRNEWIDEAMSFQSEWEAATGKKPTLSDVIAECKDIATDRESREAMESECGGVKEYAKKLYGFMIDQ